MRLVSSRIGADEMTCAALIMTFFPVPVLAATRQRSSLLSNDSCWSEWFIRTLLPLATTKSRAASHIMPGPFRG